MSRRRSRATGTRTAGASSFATSAAHAALTAHATAFAHAPAARDRRLPARVVFVRRRPHPLKPNLRSVRSDPGRALAMDQAARPPGTLTCTERTGPVAYSL